MGVRPFHREEIDDDRSIFSKHDDEPDDDRSIFTKSFNDEEE